MKEKSNAKSKSGASKPRTTGNVSRKNASKTVKLTSGDRARAQASFKSKPTRRPVSQCSTQQPGNPATKRTSTSKVASPVATQPLSRAVLRLLTKANYGQTLLCEPVSVIKIPSILLGQQRVSANFRLVEDRTGTHTAIAFLTTNPDIIKKLHQTYKKKLHIHMVFSE